MKATVVVITYSFKRFKDTIETINSLLSQTLKDKEIIVVVDRNYDLSLALRDSLHPNICVKLCKNGGASSARNLGAKSARGDIIAFIDDDIIVNKDWLLNLVRNFENPSVIGAGGRIRPLWTKGSSNILPEELYWIIGCTYAGHPEKKCQARNVFGGNFAFRREVFNKLFFPLAFQRMENSLRGTEDTQFCMNVLQAFKGSKIVYDPEAVAYHRVYAYRESSRYLLQRAYSEGLCKAYISKFCKACKGQRNLTTEYNYLRDTITKFLPKRIMKIFRGEELHLNIKYLFQISIVIFTVFIGYLRGFYSFYGSNRLCPSNSNA